MALVVLVALFFFLYVGAEVSFGGWIYTYALRQTGADFATDPQLSASAAYLASAFWGALTAGRLLAIPLALRLRARTILFFDLLGALLSVGALLIWPGVWNVIWAGTLGAGVCMASIFPTTLVLAERRMPLNGRVTGWFFVGAGAGGMGLPWLDRAALRADWPAGHHDRHPARPAGGRCSVRGPDALDRRAEPPPGGERSLAMYTSGIMKTPVEVRDSSHFHELADAATQRVQASLSELALDVHVFEFTGPHLTAAAGAYSPLDFLHIGLGERIEREINFLLIVTEVELSATTRSYTLALPSELTQIGLISTRRVSPAFWGRPKDFGLEVQRLTSLMLHTLGHLLDLPHQTEPTNVMRDIQSVTDLDHMHTFNPQQIKFIRQHLPTAAREQVAERHVIRFVLAQTFENWRSIWRSVLRANPLQLLTRLPTMITAALSVVIALFFSAEIWDVGGSLSVWQLIGFILVSLTVASYALYRTFAFTIVPDRSQRVAESTVVIVAATILALVLTLLLLFSRVLRPDLPGHHHDLPAPPDGNLAHHAACDAVDRSSALERLPGQHRRAGRLAGWARGQPGAGAASALPGRRNLNSERSFYGGKSVKILQSKSRRRGGSPLGSLFTGALAAAGGWIAYSNFAIDHDLPLPDAIPAERQVLFSQEAGRISYYADRSGEGRPLVLVHSVNAAASAYEMRPLFQHFRGDRPIFALDLPGYGFSERSGRAYTPELFSAAILAMLRQQVAQPADVVALSLGCEFAARAALAEPERFHSLAMISPSGLGAKSSGRASQDAGESGASDLIYPLFSFPLWARPFFDVIASRPSVDYFLKQSFHGEPDDGLAEYGYLSAHQPGAEHAPLAFLSGKLFTPGALERLYSHVNLPILVLYDQDPYVGFERLPDLQDVNHQVETVRITPTLGLPHFEKLPKTAVALQAFWERHS